MAELVPTATEADWLAARRKGITASEIAVVMGLSPYSSPYKLWHQKLGILPPDDQSDEMEFGTFCEPYIARKFQQAHPDLYVDGDGRELHAHSARPWQMATPDRRVYDWRMDPDLVHPVTHLPALAVLECKIDNGSDEWGEPGTDEIPVHYRCQVLWQMDVIGVSRAYVACLGRDRKVREYVVEHSGTRTAGWCIGECKACDDIALMRAAATEFLQSLKDGEPPEVDYHPATGSALRALYPGEDGGDIKVRPSLAISYAAAVKRYKAAERRKDEMTNAVLEVLRNKKRAIDPRTGDPIATRSVSHPRRVNLDTLRALYPDVAAVCTPEPKAEVRLLPAKTKKEKKNVSPDSE